jgi:large repetitive protein
MKKKLLQSFCFILALIVTLTAKAQVEFSISKVGNNYQVKMRPTVNYSGTAANTLSAQVTIVAPTGTFTPDVSSLQSQFGSWTYVTQIERAPSENPNSDYITFYMSSPVQNVNYVAGQETNLFSFSAAGSCSGNIQLMNNNTDAFFPNPTNSRFVNVGNQIAISGNGNLNNAWSGNYGSSIVCPGTTVIQVCGIKYELVKIGSNTYQVNMIPQVTFTGSGNITATQQITLKVPTGLAYTNFTSLTAGANYIQGSRVNSPSQAASNDYIMFNLSNLGTSALTYTNNVSVPLFKFDVPGACSGSLALMPNNDPFTANTTYNSKQQLTVNGYGAPDIPICFEGTGVVACPASQSCLVEYEIETLSNGKFQVSMIPKVTYTGTGNTTSTQQVTLKVPTGFQYTNFASSISGVSYVQGSRINAPAQATSSDYIIFNLSSLGTTNITYTNGVKVPLFTFEKVGVCNGSLALMPDNDPFVSNISYNSRQQLTVNGYGAPDIPVCLKGTGTAACPATQSCLVEYEIETLSNGKFQISMIPQVTYTGTGNTTSTQQVTVKVPAGFQYANLTSLIAGANYIQGSRVNTPSQASSNDYIFFNLASLGTTALTYTAGVKVPLFTFEKSGACTGSISLMASNDPFVANTSYNSRQQLTVLGYGQPDIPVCLKGSGSAACPVASSCQVEYELERLSNGKFQVSIIPRVTYTGTGNQTSTQQVTIKVPTGFVYTNLTNLVAGANFVQGSRVNTPSQATSNDYIMFNLATLGTGAITYTNGVKVPLFTFEKSGACSGSIALMQNNDPFTANSSYNSKQQLTVQGYGQPDIPLCIKGTGAVPCGDVCTIKYQLESANGCDYQVSIIPDTTWASPHNITKTAKVTLRVPHNCFTVADLTNLNFGANFTVAQIVQSPPDNPTYDYICFSMTTVPTVAIPYVKGVKVPLFTFKNSGTCCGNIELMPSTDPFAHGNTLNQNLDQHWTTSGTSSSGVEPCIVGSPLPCVSNNSSNIAGLDRNICQGGSTLLSVTGTYASYNWSPATGLSCTTCASPLANPSVTTTYYVTATTAAGCPIKDDVIVNVTPTPVISSVNAANSTNCASANGSIVVNATGSGILEYSINGGTNWVTSGTFNNLSAGSYTVMVRTQGTTCARAYGQNPVVITASGAPTITTVISSNPNQCNVNNGQIIVLISGTTGPYQYSINNGLNYQVSPIFANLAAGTYNIKVVDASNSCSVTYPAVTLTAPVAPSNISATTTAVTNCNLTNGTITVSASGGVAPLEYSIDNGATWQTSTVFNNVAAGSYNVSVRNANGSCISNIAAPVVVAMPVMANVTNIVAVQPTACGATNGSISVNATGGTAPLEYSIDNGQTWQASSSFANLASGTYYVQIRNNGGTCPKSYPGNPIVLNTGAAPSILTVVKTLTSDCALNDASIAINASGSGVLEYSINGGTNYQTSPNFINLAPGSYNIRVRIQGGAAACTSSLPTCIIPAKTSPNLLSANATPATDCGMADGTITINAINGIAPLQYSINGTAWQNANVFTNVPAGTYTVYVRNADGSCKQTSSSTYTVTQPTSLTNVTGTATIATCGQNTGSITMSATGGTAPYQYSLNGISWQNSNIFSNLQAGLYTIYARSANGTCATPTQTPISVSQSTGPNPTSVIVSNATDCGVNNGSITIIAAGGTPPFQYSINGGVTFQSSNIFTNLAGSTYSIVVRNGNGTCPSIVTPITVTQPEAPSIITAIASNPTGCGYNNGTITIIAYGGIEPLEYSIDGITWQTSSTFLYVPAGTYTIRVRNSNGTCVKTWSNTVTLINTATPPAITNVAKTNPASCVSADGTISITSNPSTGVEYSVDNIHWQASNIFTGLSAGTYTAYVRNLNGTCATAYSLNPIILSPAASHSITNVTSVNPSCGTSNGSLTITASPNTNLLYSINGNAPQASNIFSNLAQGTYNILVTNTLTGCNVTYPAVTLTAPSAPVITSVVPKNPTTCNSNDGEISITATSGLAPLQYSINGTTWQASSTFNGLAANTYTVYVKNADNSCQVQGIVPIILTAPSAPSVSNIVATQPTTCAATDGTIVVTATGGTGSYEYKITGRNWQSSNSFTGLAAGSYTVEVRITNSTCVGTYAQNPVVLTGTAAHSVSSVNVINPTCGSNNGQLVVTMSGVGGPFQYSLNGGPYQYSPYFAGLAAGSYIVTVRDASGACSVNSPNTTLTAPSAPTILATTPTATSDCGTADGAINVTATGGVPPLEYSLDGINWQVSNIFTNLLAGSYSVRVRNADNTCMVTGNAPVVVNMPPMPSITNVIANSPTACGSATGTIVVSGTGGQGALEYSIDNGVNWQTGGTFTNLASGTYYVLIRNQDNTCSKPYPGNPVVINAGQAPAIVTVVKTKPTTCGGSDGKIEITAQGTAVLEYSINNGVSYQASNVFTGLASGSYNVVVRYANTSSCTASVPNCVIPASVAPTISGISATPVSDCGQADGTITVAASGGVAPLQYSINNGASYQLSNIFTGVAAGTYTIKVRNADGSCEVTHNVNINVTAPIAPSIVSATPTTATCGTLNGSITVVATGGIAPLQYSINGINWQVSNVFNNLQAGSYYVFVRSNNGTCRTSTNNLVVVSQTTGPNTSAVTVNHVTNCTNPNGSLTITATGGTAPIQYSIDGGVNFQASNVFSNLNAGTYNIVVRNADGTCPSIVTPITIISPIVPTILTVSATNPSDCNSGGSIVVSANGANLEYSINGTTWQVSNIFTNVPTGTYTILVRNAANTTCVTTAASPVTITAPAPPTVVSVISAGPASCGLNNGTITITSNPSTGVQYSIDNIHWQSAGLFTNLAAGTYNVKIRYNSGYCVTNYTSNPVTLTVQSGPQVASTIVSNPTDCNVNNGSITIYMTGGIAPYQYSKDNGATYQFSNVFPNLAAGTYSILIKDGTGSCQTTTSATLTAPTAPATPILVATPATTCTTPSGTVTVASPLGANLQYSINNGATWQTSPTFNNLNVGNYVVIARVIGTSCASTSAPVTITMPEMPVIAGVDAIFDVLACDVTSASIFIDISNTGNWEYSINGGITWSSSNQFNNLPQGSYWVFARPVGKPDCAKEYLGNPIIITAPSAPQVLDVEVIHPTTCLGSDGKITIIAQGATEYSIDNGATYQTSNIFGGLSSGTYAIKVKNADGCVSNGSSAKIQGQSDAPQNLTAVASPKIDCSTNNGTITVTNITGGIPPYQFSIDGVNWQTSNVFTGLNSGNYLLRTRNQGTACAFVAPNSLDVTAPAAPILNNVTSTPAGCGTTNGTITISASTGALYSIDGVNYQTSGAFANVAPGSYTVYIKNANGTCVTPYPLNPVVVSQAPGAAITNVTTVQPTCTSNVGSITITASGGVPPLEYSINGGVSFQSSNTFTSVVAGTYNIVVRGSGASAQCPVTYPQIVLAAPASPQVVTSIGINPTNCQNNGTITVLASGGTASLEYSLNGGAWQQNNLFAGLAVGTYTVSVRNANGTCATTSPTQVTLTSPAAPTISNVAKTNPTTCVATNGTITITATGVGALEYSINGYVWQNTNVFNNLPAGSYTVYVRNANGTCSVAYAQNPVQLLGAGSPNIVSVDKTNMTDCNKSNGTITIEVTNTGAQYKYSIDNGVTYQLSNYFAGLSAGTYQIKVTDLAGNCPATFPNVVITSPTGASIVSVNTTPTTNCNSSTGSIAVTSNPATGVQYSIDNGTNWTNSNIFTNLPAGSYIVKIRNANGTCEVTNSTPAVIGEPTKPTITGFTRTNPTSCLLSDGSITITATGTGALEYSLNGTNWQTANTFTGLVAGSYIIFVRNAGTTCIEQYAQLAVLSVTDAPSINSVSSANPNTCNGNNGSISIVAFGTGTLEYSINGGGTWQTSKDFTGLAAGNYNIRVRTQGLTCAVTYPTINLVAPQAPAILAVSPTAPTDCDLNDGKIAISATNSRNEPMEYSVDGTNWYNVNTVMYLAPGTYTARVRILGTNCISTAAPVTITAPTTNLVITNVATINPTACGANNGQITITATGGTAPLQYSIDNINWQASNVFTNLPAGTYFAYVRSAGGICKVANASNPVILTPGVNSPIILNASKTNITDCGKTDGTITINATGGIAPLQYSIDGGRTWSNNASFANLPAGYYNIMARNADGTCATILTPIQITAPTPPSLVDAFITKAADCANPTAQITVLAAGGIAPLQYSIDNKATWHTNSVFPNLGIGYYFVWVRNSDGTCPTPSVRNPIVSCEFDLALRKKLATNQPAVVRLGSDVEFEIKVFNQGVLTAKNIDVVDYLPAGTILSPKDNNGWSYIDVNGNPLASTAIIDPSKDLKVKKRIADPLVSLDSVAIKIKLRVIYGVANARLVNVAEISGATDISGIVRGDADSTPDDIKGNDKEVDDVTDDKNILDEDDEDPAPFQLDDYDPHGYIYCDKEGTLLQGGKVVLLTAPPGGSIYFVRDANGVLQDGTNGVYQFFTNGVPGNYTIGYQHPAGYQLSTMILPNVGTFNPAGTDGTAIDRDNTVNNVVQLGSLANNTNTELLSIAAGANPYYLAFTFNPNEPTIISHNNLPVGCACVNSVVCEDVNGNGVAEPTEPGINGVTVEAYNCVTNAKVGQAITANGGKYKISGLLAGSYKLKFIAPSGYSYIQNGSPVAVNSQGETACFPLGYAGCEDKPVCLKTCPSLTVSPNVTICAGSSATLTVAGGTTYTWVGSGLNTTTGASVIASPTTTTVYTVSSVSNNGCNISANVTVTVVAPPANNFSVSVTAPTSCTNNNGQISITATPNTGLEYSIDNGTNWSANSLFSGIAPGTYLVKIRFAGSLCSTAYPQNPVQVVAPLQPTITNVVTVNPNNCTNPNGTITITVAGGSGSYQYSIDNGANWQFSNQFNNLAAGNYNIKVRNANATCEINYPVVTLSNNLPVINAVNVVSDCANNNRSITILASGGQGPLEYTINNGLNWTTNNVFTNLAAGYYTVKVRNFNGTCEVPYANGQIAMCAFDLALEKKLAPGQTNVVRLGDVINYQVIVFNQGAIDAHQVQVVDYIPTGMQLFPFGNNGWTAVGTDMATNTIPFIAANTSITLNLSMRLVFGSPNASLRNGAEIKEARDANGNLQTDIDSTPDMIKGNDTVKDGVKNENGKNNPNDDEDDHDIEDVTLDNFDPSGYIYCEKTGKVLTGGKIKAVSMPQGGEVFFTTDASGKLLDGSTGMYQVFTNGVAGVYTFTYEHPNGYPLSTTCLPQAGPFNPAGNDGNPAYDTDGIKNGIIHLGSLATNGALANKSCSANKYYLSFNLEKDEKVLIATNNIPVACGVIIGKICNDANNAGVQGMKISLFDCNSTTGVAIATTITDSDGKYSFDALKAGSYKVQLTTAQGQIIKGGTFNQQGFSDCKAIAYGQCLELNACLSACPTINNVLVVKPWCPKNNGVIIIDAVCQGDLQYSIDNGATYQHLNAFMNLAPGTYRIKVKSAGCEQDYKDVVVLPCEDDNTGGGKGSISGKAFKDCTGAGFKGTNLGAANVKVTLSGTSTQTTTTDANGRYSFNNIDAGNYIVTFEKPAGFEFSNQNQGGNDANDSDVSSNGITNSINVAANQLVDNVDAGLKDIQGPAISFTHPWLVGKKHNDDIYMECSEEYFFSAKDALLADNCDKNPKVKFGEDPAIFSKDCEKDKYLVKMHCGWIATDECGNKSEIWFNFYVRDTKAPDLQGVPANITVAALSQIPTAANVTAKDKCDKSAKVIFDESQNGNTVTRTWTAVDACGNKSTGTQIITVVTNNNGCKIQNPPVAITSPATCGLKDGKAKMAPNSFNFKWSDGSTAETRLDLGAGTYIVTVTDAQGCTAEVLVKILDGCGTQILRLADEVAVKQLSCDTHDYEYCLDLDLKDLYLGGYELRRNGEVLSGIKPCEIRRHHEFALAGIENYTNVTLEEWTINGKKFDGVFNSLEALLDMMNTWDKGTTWTLDKISSTIKTENTTAGRYGAMKAKLTDGSGLAWNFSVNEYTTSHGLRIPFDMGEHRIELVHKATNYRDTTVLALVCTTPNDIILDMIEGDETEIDLTTKELYGSKCAIKVCYEENNPVAEFHDIPKKEALKMVEAMYVGEERITYTMCDEYNVCDTTRVKVVVREKKKDPIKIDSTIVIFNGFSPNEDGNNDVFLIKNIEYFPNSTLTVYNRWGNAVFTQEAYQNNWKGTYEGAGLPDGTYFYVLEVKGQKTRSGYVELRR